MSKNRATYDEWLDGVEADVLRVRICEIRPKQGDERSRVDRSRLDHGFDDLPVGACDGDTLRPITPYATIRPHDARGDEH